MTNNDFNFVGSLEQYPAITSMAGSAEKKNNGKNIPAKRTKKRDDNSRNRSAGENIDESPCGGLDITA